MDKEREFKEVAILEGQDKLDRILRYFCWEIKEENVNNRNMFNNLKYRKTNRPSMGKEVCPAGPSTLKELVFLEQVGSAHQGGLG